jgi:L-glutamine-phosphate cytidylyltransferase
MTTGIVIAAGLGSRMGNLTAERPKCMLPVAGRPLLHRTLDVLRHAGCDRLVVVTGYCAYLVDAPGAELVHNPNFRANNILHSLMCAQSEFEGAVVCTYGDIWLEDSVVESVLEQTGDIVLAVDRDWRPYYEGRSGHPLGEAEKVHVDSGHRARSLGKHIDPAPPTGCETGEFVGLWRMTPAGATRFRATFLDVSDGIAPESPFMAAAEWRKAYVTDLLQHMINLGEDVVCARVHRGWAELDTREDYERLEQIAKRQRLDRIVDWSER